MSLERDIYKMYLEGPYDWLNPVDMFTEFLTDTSTGAWSSKSHEDKIYEIFEKPMIKILAFMEIEGIKIDNKFLKTLSLKFQKKIEKIQKEVFKLSKKEFNIASPKQLGEIIYNDLKIANLATFATSTLSDATYLRVHDVELTKDTVQVINKAQSLI